MKKIICIVALAVLSFCLDAKSIQREEKFASLAGISVSDDFNVKLVDGPSIVVTMTMEDVLADFVHMSLVDGILSIDYDSKSLTKEVKAVLKNRDPKSLVMDVVISIPASCNFKSISICDNVVLSSKASFGSSQSFEVNVDGNAVIKSLNVNASEAVLNAKKHADVKATLTCGKTTVNSSGSCVLELNVSGSEACVTSEGSSTVRLNSSVSATLALNTSSSAKLFLKGTAGNIEVNAANYSNIDASALETKTANLKVNSASCDVNASEKLSLSLSGGAKVKFSGNPVIDIAAIEKSSVSRKESEQAATPAK